MFIGVILVVLLSLCSHISADATLNKYNHFAKKVAAEILVGGRLTIRQIGSLADAGVKSIISIANFNTNDDSYNSILGDFPSSSNEQTLAQSLGMKADVYPASLTPQDVEIVSLKILQMPKPLFIHCHVR